MQYNIQGDFIQQLVVFKCNTKYMVFQDLQQKIQEYQSKPKIVTFRYSINLKQDLPENRKFLVTRILKGTPTFKDAGESIAP